MNTWTGEAVLKMAGELCDNNYEQCEAEDAVKAIDKAASGIVTEAHVSAWWAAPHEDDEFWDDDDRLFREEEPEEKLPEEPVEVREPKYSQIVDPVHGVVLIDCSECSRGGNGKDRNKCPHGGQIKVPERHCCNEGKLMRGLQFGAAKT
jgi:hypothetical protein